MNGMNERIAYLKGLVEGLDISNSSAEGRVLVEVIEVLDAISRSVDQLELSQEQVEDYVIALDEDLSDLESDFYEDDYIDTDELPADMQEDLEELGYLQIHCPNCNETVYVDQDIFEDDDVLEVLCPECNETIMVNDDSPMLTSIDGE